MSEETKNETVTQEAQRICYGDRNQDYGHPLDECERMAKLWSVILGMTPTPEQVCLCLIQMKVSREINKPKRDNRVDICGYAECLDRIVTEKIRRQQNIIANEVGQNESVVFWRDDKTGEVDATT